MARKQRIFYPGAFYHVMLRGNHKQCVFFTDVDRVKFYLLLQEGVERFEHRIHAFCLMDNHVHLVIQAADKSISKAIQNVAFRYSQYLNKQVSTTGHRFQGRFNAKLIDEDTYLTQVIKYIHLNPVKAGMCALPEEYLWSSHNHYLGAETIHWVERDFALKMFDKHLNRAQDAYKSFVDMKMDPNAATLIRTPNARGNIIGDDDFVRVVEETTKINLADRNVSIETIIKLVSKEFQTPTRLFHCSRNTHVTQARDVVGYFISKFDHLTYLEAEKLTRRDHTLFGRGAKKIEIQCKLNSELNQKIQHIRSILNMNNERMF